jgi:hypothetical protein
MQVFIAGVMQGSRTDDMVSDQDYRQVITQLLQENLRDVEIVDPWALHPGSEKYSVERARDTFMTMTTLAGQVDVLVAYIPEASMGTAIEIWEAHRSGVRVFSISPMADNWVVKLFSSQVFPTLEAFRGFVSGGGLSCDGQSIGQGKGTS